MANKDFTSFIIDYRSIIIISCCYLRFCSYNYFHRYTAFWFISKTNYTTWSIICKSVGANLSFQSVILWALFFEKVKPWRRTSGQTLYSPVSCVSFIWLTWLHFSLPVPICLHHTSHYTALRFWVTKTLKNSYQPCFSLGCWTRFELT